jgi:hypothetical protein
MDSLTIADIICMILNREGPSPQANLDVLRTLYERTHARYMGVLIMFMVLTASVMGVFVASALSWGETKISILAMLALVLLLISLTLLARRLNQLTRTYLDIIKVYNLLSRYVESTSLLESSEILMR